MTTDVDKIFDAVQDYLIRSLRGFIQRLAVMEKRIAEVRDGKDGLPGKDGAVGPQGERGLDGDRGIDGKDGAIGPEGVQGPWGEKGEKGEKGEQGYRGAQGEQGLSGERGAAGEQGPQGAQGQKGADGKEGAVGERGERGEAGERGPQGERGSDGNVGERGAVGERGPAGERGEKGDVGQGEKGADGLQGLQGLPGEKGAQGEQGPIGERGYAGKDGKDGEVNLGMLRDLIQREVAKAVAEIPIPKDGEAGRDGRDGKPGAPGRDATQIEYLSTLDPTRTYARGTHARFAGGILRAMRTTDPFVNGNYEAAGWEAAIFGFRGGEIVVSEDARDFTLRIFPTAGPAIETKFHVPVPRHRGVWKEMDYVEGDMVTWGGSTWHANTSTRAKPGTNSDWTLAVKRGNDGRDARQ